MAQPTEIAGAAMFLLFDHVSFVTGAAMLEVGGHSIANVRGLVRAVERLRVPERFLA